MRGRRLLWQLYPSYAIIIIIAIIVVTWYASASFRKFSHDQTAADLELQGRLILNQYGTLLAGSDPQTIRRLCDELGQLTGIRFTAVLLSGQVIADSEHDPTDMDNHADRPEIMEAVTSGRGRAIRYSHTMGRNMMYVAVPISDGEKILGTLRLSLPITDLEETLHTVYMRIAWGGLVAAILAAGISFFVSRRISRPLEQMRRAAGRFADGDLEHKMLVPPIRELGGLAATMNQMAGQLHERIQVVVRQRNEQEAVLASMVEGVLAVDDDARLKSLNQAAADLLTISKESAQGKTLHEVVRNAALLEFVEKVLSTGKSGESEIALYEKEERYLQVHGTILKDAQGSATGALFVMNDITGIRRLETMRRDFVANVSHELKTPVTSVKGFVETLLDGAMDDPETARRFLTIIGRQADRLKNIIEDLLSLSRLEQEAQEARVSMSPESLRPILDSATQACELKASEKNIEITVDCPDEIVLNLNALLLEQAIINLIDNAVKYSDEGSKVEVKGVTVEDHAVIEVSDHGIGIAGEHLSRLFERFYRVDKARSREMGGTGLGLAIVKHIAHILGGHTSVDSILGKGSTFRIHLPLK